MSRHDDRAQYFDAAASCWWKDQNYTAEPLVRASREPASEATGSAVPPYSNTGRTQTTPTTQGTGTVHHDWIGFTVQLDGKSTERQKIDARIFGTGEVPQSVYLLTCSLQKVFTVPFHLNPRPGGWQGYETRYDIQTEAGYAGLIATGGEFMRGTTHCEITGDGTAFIDPFALRDYLESECGKLTRCDIACDEFHTGINRAHWAVDQYETKSKGMGFQWTASSPNIRTIENSDQGGNRHLETVYIGRRESGKLLRVYDKGIETGAAGRGEWWRMECEFRAVHRRPLSLMMLTSPAEFLAGAYPCLSFIATMAYRLKCVKRVVQASAHRVIKAARHFVGNTIAWLKQNGVNEVDIVNLLNRPTGRLPGALRGGRRPDSDYSEQLAEILATRGVAA